jgi:FkbM family methyltransferase
MRIKRLLLSPLIVARYGTLWPDEVVLPVSRHRVAINPHDERAYRRLVMDSVRHLVSTPMMFWRDHVAHLKPSLCLDIGANYGECFAHGDYPESACVAVEANPILLPHLEKTGKAHPDAARITVVSCLASDQDGAEGELFYTENWTGGGSALRGDQYGQSARVPCRTIDAVVAEHDPDPGGPLVVKVDVEGYEGKVLAGFSRLFERATVAGILEFDTTMLAKAGTAPEDVFGRLAGQFQVFLTFRRKRRLMPMPDWAAFRRRFPAPHAHCDLAFFSDPAAIAPGWRVADGGPGA